MCGCQKGRLGQPPQMPIPNQTDDSGTIQARSARLPGSDGPRPPFFGAADSGASVFPVLNIQFGTPLLFVLR